MHKATSASQRMSLSTCPQGLGLGGNGSPESDSVYTSGSQDSDLVHPSFLPPTIPDMTKTLVLMKGLLALQVGPHESMPSSFF